MNCRICGAQSTEVAGEVEYYLGYRWKIFDCATCQCRFTRHDDSVYELLHESTAVSYYKHYRDLAAGCAELFQQRDLIGLKSLLRSNSKYAFVIDEIERLPLDSRTLEIGCSRGYLTSCFILQGRDILGVDVSSVAVESARTSFGPHFSLVGDPAITAGAPYDAIYHVGMIGCVSDPVGLTRQMLALLKPGGRLLFNAPNRRSCNISGQLWFDSAPPPDVVTLFPPGFWTRHFVDLAETHEYEEMLPLKNGFMIGLRKLFGRLWTRPTPRSISSAVNGVISPPGNSEWIWGLFERAVVKAGMFTRLAHLAPRQPSEYGLYVKMVKRG